MASNKRVLIFGSSVACGYYANTGWGARLDEALTPRGFTTENFAQPGFNTSETLNALKRITKNKPQLFTPQTFVIVGLSLANEGMQTKLFLENLKLMVQLIRDTGSKPILGGVYPNNLYSPTEYEKIKTNPSRNVDLGYSCSGFFECNR